MPTSIGYQDLTALFARQPGVSQRWREHLIASPFGTIETATFSYARPIGTAMPAPLGYRTVNFDPRSLDANVWRIDRPLAVPAPKRIVYPAVNRQHKGDRLPLVKTSPAPSEPANLPQLRPINASPTIAPPVSQPTPPPAPIITPRPKIVEQHDVAPPVAHRDVLDPTPIAPVMTPRPKAADEHDAAPTVAEGNIRADAVAEPPLAPIVMPRPADSEQHNPAPSVAYRDVKNDAAVAPAPASSLVFGAAGAVATHVVPPPKNDNARTANADDDMALADKPPDIPAAGENDTADGPPSALASLSFIDENPSERSAQVYFGSGAMGSPSGLAQWAPGAEPVPETPSVDAGIKLSALEGTVDDAGAGESVASKDDATRLESPAERLGLIGKPRARAEKCLADAVYFEARGEPVKGQEAVAQVVMNRVFSGYYPDNVCGVVYQNASHHLACQFTFACEGKDLSKVDEPDMWEQAKRIAKNTLDGKIWLAEVGHATHYHAYWVHPSWVHEMTRLYKLGVHTFYRPRAWGNGDDEPVWGTPPSTSKADDKTGKPEASAKNPSAPAKEPGAAAKGPEAEATPPEPAATAREQTAKL